MVAMIKRILNLAGKHKSKILLGILFNFLKSVCMAMVLWAVYIVASDLDSLTMDVIWKAFGKYSECTYNDSNGVGTIFHDGGH